MAGDFDAKINGAATAYQAFRNLTVDRSHTLGTLDLVKNSSGQITELKCKNHHFLKFWGNDARSVTMESANELRRAFEQAVDYELQKFFDQVLNKDETRKNVGVTEVERDVLLGKMKAVKESFHKAIFPQGCETKKIEFSRKDIRDIVKNVDALIGKDKLSVQVLLAADVDELCKMASDSTAAENVEYIRQGGNFSKARYTASIAKEQMKKCDAKRILGASDQLADQILPKYTRKNSANLAELLESANEILEDHGISTVVLGADGKLALRKPVKLEGEELNEAVRKDVAAIIDDINSDDCQIRNDIAEEAGFDADTGNEWSDRYSATNDFLYSLAPGEGKGEEGVQKQVGLRVVADSMKQHFRSDSKVEFGNYVRAPIALDVEKKAKDISKHLSKFKTNYKDEELGRDGYHDESNSFDLDEVDKFVAKRYKGDNEIEVFLDVISKYSRKSGCLRGSYGDEKIAYRNFLKAIKQDVENACREKKDLEEGKFKARLQSLMYSYLEVKTSKECRDGEMQMVVTGYYDDLEEVLNAVEAAIVKFNHS